VFFFTRRGDPFRASAVRFASIWTLAWMIPCLLGAWVYWRAVPSAMAEQVAVAMTTQAFTQWHAGLVNTIVVALIAMTLVALWGVIRPRWLPGPVLVVPFVLCLALLACFERVREFVRKPYVIADYMYANGVRVEDYPLLEQEGMLAHATYVPARQVTQENRHEVGEAIFTIACTRCHTTTGLNGVVGKLTDASGTDEWGTEHVVGFLRAMHGSRPYMPPFPGNEEEMQVLADYLVSLKADPRPVPGAQREGVSVPHGQQPVDSEAQQASRHEARRHPSS
jgi:hypothetical protein